MIQRILILTVFFLASCASMFVSERLHELDRYFEPLLGTATQADIASEWGAPDDHVEFGDLSVWTYFQSYGSRSTGYHSPGSQYGSWANGSSIESYDKVSMSFDADGILTSWKALVQR